MAATTHAPPGRLSPSTSPRLPSPPPFPEMQIGPKSPTSGTSGEIFSQDIETNSVVDSGAARRIRPGTKASDMASGPPLVPLSELDSPFQLQEHLKALHFDYTKSEHNTATIPINRETAHMLSTPPNGVDRSLWLYELCRFLVQKANILIIDFFTDTPPCSAQNCPEMRASEWQYLCAVHDPPKSCCAIDYCCHTLDWAANVLTSPKHFPSRLTLGTEGAGGSQQGVRQLTNIFRRVYRMFAHAWFQHREVFWNVENREGLYILYKTVCDDYNLIPEENYTVPVEAEGLAAVSDHSRQQEEQKHPEVNPGLKLGSATDAPKEPDSELPGTSISTGATTRRHKHTPSTGAFVTTIAEGDEEPQDSPGRDRRSFLDNAAVAEGTKIAPITSIIPSEPLVQNKVQNDDENITQVEQDKVSSLSNDMHELVIEDPYDSLQETAPATGLESVEDSGSENTSEEAKKLSVDSS